MQRVVFDFDIISPYAYLAFERLPAALEGVMRLHLRRVPPVPAVRRPAPGLGQRTALGGHWHAEEGVAVPPVRLDRGAGRHRVQAADAAPVQSARLAAPAGGQRAGRRASEPAGGGTRDAPRLGPRRRRRQRRRRADGAHRGHRPATRPARRRREGRAAGPHGRRGGRRRVRRALLPAGRRPGVLGPGRDGHARARHARGRSSGALRRLQRDAGRDAAAGAASARAHRNRRRMRWTPAQRAHCPRPWPPGTPGPPDCRCPAPRRSHRSGPRRVAGARSAASWCRPSAASSGASPRATHVRASPRSSAAPWSATRCRGWRWPRAPVLPGAHRRRRTSTPRPATCGRAHPIRAPSATPRPRSWSRPHRHAP